MNKRTILILLALVLSLEAEAKSPIAKEDVLILHQKNRLLGQVIVYCNSSHVKLVSCESKAALVANAPLWNVQIYDPVRKLTYDASKTQFFDSGFTGPFQKSGLIERTMQVIGMGRFLRLPAIAYAYRENDQQTSRYWILKDPQITGTVCQVLQALYQAPPAPGIPLALETTPRKQSSGADNFVIFSDQGGCVLTTGSCEKGTLPLSEFAYMKGYKKARFGTDVLVNPKIKEDMEAGLQEFGLGLGKTK